MAPLTVTKAIKPTEITYTIPVQVGAGATVSTVKVGKVTGRLRVTLDLDAALANGSTWETFCAQFEAGNSLV